MKTEPTRILPLLARLSVRIPNARPQEGEQRPPNEPPGTLYTMTARETTDDN